MDKYTYAQSSLDIVNNKEPMATVRATAGGFYSNIDSGVSVKPPFTRTNYEYFRPAEQIPVGRTQQDYRRIMELTSSAYESVGLVRSVIDLMTEFVIDGLEIIHEQDSPNNFWAEWQKKVRLKEAADQFVRWAYKSGNVVVRGKYGKVDTSDVKKLSTDQIALGKQPNVKPGYIPLGYIFYRPSAIEIVGGQLASLAEKKKYGIRIPLKLFDTIRNPTNAVEKEVWDTLPQEVKDAVMAKNTEATFQSVIIPLPEDKTYVGHYKKDDSDTWAKSFLYSILGDIFYNQKIKLAKTAGLDGWCNSIRIWKLGDTANQNYPSPALFNKLISLLEQNAGGGAMDIVWRSDIEVQEIYPPVEKLANLNENNDNILYGLGVPTALVGGPSQGGSDNLFLGLKNFASKVETGRRMLIDWLEREIDVITRNMGFKKRPTIRFSYTNFHDDRAMFNMLIQMVDRNIISDTTLLERIKEYPGVEENRIQYEEQLREAKKLPPKASPFHKPDLVPQQNHEINKIREQSKQQIKVNEAKPPSTGPTGLNSPNILNKKPSLQNPNGRPPGKKDSVKRTKKAKSYAQLLVQAAKAYDYCDNWLKDECLKMWGLATARSISAKQEEELDKFRMALYPNIDPYEDLSDQVVLEAGQSPDGPISEFKSLYEGLLQDLGSEGINLEVKRMLRIEAYARAWLEQ